MQELIELKSYLSVVPLSEREKDFIMLLIDRSYTIGKNEWINATAERYLFAIS